MGQAEQFRELVEDIKTAMLITQAENGKLSGRPMGTAEIDKEGNIWFFTNEFSKKVAEISHESKVLLSYASPSKNSYISVNGIASLVDDKEKIKALWNPMLNAWFPEGLDDPKLLLIKVDPQEAEYWESSSSKIVLGLKMIKAIFKGEVYNEEGEHGKLTV